MLDLIDLVVLHCITEADVPPTFDYLIGHSPTWAGAVNRFLQERQIRLFDAQPIKSDARLQQIINRLRDLGYLENRHRATAEPTEKAIELVELLGADWRTWEEIV